MIRGTGAHSISSVWIPVRPSVNKRRQEGEFQVRRSSFILVRDFINVHYFILLIILEHYTFFSQYVIWLRFRKVSYLDFFACFFARTNSGVQDPCVRNEIIMTTKYYSVLGHCKRGGF